MSTPTLENIIEDVEDRINHGEVSPVAISRTFNMSREQHLEQEKNREIFYANNDKIMKMVKGLTKYMYRDDNGNIYSFQLINNRVVNIQLL